MLWTSRWNLRPGVTHDVEIVADPCAHVVFECGDTPGARVVGVWTSLWRRTLQGRGVIRAARLRAGAIRCLTDEPAWTWTNRVVPMTQALPALTGKACDAVAHSDDSAALEALQSLLLAIVRPLSREGELAVELAAQAAHDSTIRTAEQLARLAGTSLRSVQRLFRNHVGAPPKWLILRHRLQEAAQRLETRDRASLADLAADLGFSDQAHLTREFRRITGRTPRGFADLARANDGDDKVGGPNTSLSSRD